MGDPEVYSKKKILALVVEEAYFVGNEAKTRISRQRE